MQTLWKIIAVSAFALVLTACGGGGGGGGGSADAGNTGAGTNNLSSSPSANNGGTTPPAKPATSIPTATPTPTPPPVSSTSYHVQLVWTPPSTRANGSPLPLSELAGYRIYYLLEGTDPSSDSVVSVTNGSTTTFSLTLPAPGSYTFAITAVDQNGLESSLSSPVSAPVN